MSFPLSNLSHADFSLHIRTAAVAGAVDNVEKRDVSSGAVGLEEKKRN